MGIREGIREKSSLSKNKSTISNCQTWVCYTPILSNKCVLNLLYFITDRNGLTIITNNNIPPEMIIADTQVKNLICQISKQ